jgi:phenylacetate-coenzyme A ligase PaaK-like adenylate-forming protein
MGVPVSFRAALRDVFRSGRFPPGALESLKKERLASLVAFARARSPFYRDLLEGLPERVENPAILPPVTKSLLMENFDAAVTDPEASLERARSFVSDGSLVGRRFLGRYVAFSTSGTTGTPAVFLHDDGAMSVYAALTALRRLLPLASAGMLRAVIARGGRTATVVATGGHFASSVVEGLVRRSFPRLSGFNRTFSILRPMKELVAALNDFRPAVLGTYPTALSVLAQEQAEGALRIRPALALTGSESLTPAVRSRASASFRCPVRDTYAASEFMGIAFDCSQGLLHVNADWAILEPADAAGRPVPPGRASHTAFLTNLANRVQPLLRYDLGDSVTILPEPCPCGSPFPAVRVEGRRDEILYFRGADDESVPILPMSVATAVEETRGIRSWQAVRSGPSRLRIAVEEAPGADRSRVMEEAVRRLREYLASQGLGGVSVEASEEPPRRDTSGGKQKQVIDLPDSG